MREKISTSVDLPLSDESKRVLAYAAEEADGLNHRHLGTEHLLLALLREENFLAATLLREHGLTIGPVREELVAHGTNSSVTPSEILHSKLLAYLKSLANGPGISVSGSGLYVKPDPTTAMPACLYIEILSPTERLRDLRRRVEDHFFRGLRYVWLFDPARATCMSPRPKPASTNSKVTSCVLKTPRSNCRLPKFSLSSVILNLARSQEVLARRLRSRWLYRRH